MQGEAPRIRQLLVSWDDDIVHARSNGGFTCKELVPGSSPGAGAADINRLQWAVLSYAAPSEEVWDTSVQNSNAGAGPASADAGARRG